jgi:kynurenine formamidase
MALDDLFGSDLRTRRAEIAERQKQRDWLRRRLHVAGKQAYDALQVRGYSSERVARSIGVAASTVRKLNSDGDKTGWRPLSRRVYAALDGYARRRLGRSWGLAGLREALDAAVRELKAAEEWHAETSARADGRVPAFELSVLLPLAGESSWWLLFHEYPRRSGTARVHVGCELTDGSRVSGTLQHYALQAEETRVRELALTAPLHYRPPGSDTEHELTGTAVVALSARQIKFLTVAYRDDVAEEATAGPGMNDDADRRLGVPPHPQRPGHHPAPPGKGPPVSATPAILPAVLDALATGRLEVLDLTAPLSPDTPILHLPEPFANTIPLSLEKISDFDDDGPFWSWHNIHTGEHTGTHLHWASGRGGTSVDRIPPARLVGPAVVADFTAETSADPDFLLEPAHLDAWVGEHGPLPDGSWLLFRTGWGVRSRDPVAYANADANGPHTPGVSTAGAKWLAASPIAGFGVETVGIDAGQAGTLEPAFPVHYHLLGADKYGLTQLQGLDRLPVTGALLVVAPLPIVGGTGSPARVYALVERA